MYRVFVVVAAGLALSACSGSMPSFDWFRSEPPVHMLKLDSQPTGAEARTSLGSACNTPCTLPISTGGDFTVTFTHPGFESQTVPVQVLATDSGADPNAMINPNPVFVELAAVAPPKKKPAPKKKPRVAKQTPAPAQAAPPATAAQAPASPWPAPTTSAQSPASPWPAPTR